MNVPLMDLSLGYLEQKDALDAALRDVVERQHFIMGDTVRTFEAEIAQVLGTDYALGCASGSDALLLAMMALDIGPGDEVITTPYTFFATASCIARVGARPVFVDVDADTLNVDLDAVHAGITPKTRAFIPVHLFGQPVDLDALARFPEQTGIPVVEDAAQAIGATWGAHRAGAVGALACFSFYPTKNLGAFGDGGLVTTSDTPLKEKVHSLRLHGNHPRKYHHKYLGMNSRLDALQAAILSVRLKRLDAWNDARRENARRYTELLEAAGLADVVRPLTQRPAARGIFHQFVVRLPHRDAAQAYLKSHGVGSEVYYPKPLHLQECFADLGYAEGSMPVAEEAARTTLALPIYPGLTEAAQAYVVETLTRFYRDGAPKEMF